MEQVEGCYGCRMLGRRVADAQATIAALEETILKMGENAAVVAKDAMAAKEQVAALQARVKELEEWVQDQSTANLETMRHTDEMQSRAMKAITEALTATRRAALLEAVQQLREGARLAQSREVANALSGHAYTIDRLAQEG